MMGARMERSVLAALVLAALALAPSAAPPASAALVSIEPTGHAFGDVVAVSGVGDAEAHCGTEACVAVSAKGEARARCTDRTVFCLSLSALGPSRSTCRYGACVALSGTGDADAQCRAPGTLCQERTLGPSRACAGAFACATLDQDPRAEACYLGTCADVETFGDAEGTAAVSAFGDSRSDTLAVSGTDSATGTRAPCSPPPHSTSFCPGAVAVSGLGRAESDRRCDASFCTGRLAASGTGDADGYFAVSLTGGARGAIALQPGRQLGGSLLPALP